MQILHVYRNYVVHSRFLTNMWTQKYLYQLYLEKFLKYLSQVSNLQKSGTTECTNSIPFNLQIANVQMYRKCGCLIDRSLTKYFANEVH